MKRLSYRVGTGLGCVAASVFMLVEIAIAVGAVYVIVHFVQKFW